MEAFWILAGVALVLAAFALLAFGMAKYEAVQLAKRTTMSVRDWKPIGAIDDESPVVLRARRKG
jgi:cytochrome c-type biogenesis protein CcmH/NrfG